MAAAFAHDLFEARHELASARGVEVAIGFVLAFVSSLLVVKPFLNYVRRSGFQAFAWYRIVAGVALLAAMYGAGWGRSMFSWLRRRFITGFFVMVPLFITVAALVWIFTVVDGLTTPLYDRLLGRRIPGLGMLSDGDRDHARGRRRDERLGRRLLVRGEDMLLRVPVFKTIYAPVKQLIAAFSPDSEIGLQAGRARGARDERLRDRLPDEGVHARPRTGARGPCRRVRADQQPVSRGRHRLPRDRALFPDIALKRAYVSFLPAAWHCRQS